MEEVFELSETSSTTHSVSFPNLDDLVLWVFNILSSFYLPELVIFKTKCILLYWMYTAVWCSLCIVVYPTPYPEAKFLKNVNCHPNDVTERSVLGQIGSITFLLCISSVTAQKKRAVLLPIPVLFLLILIINFFFLKLLFFNIQFQLQHNLLGYS